MMIMVPSAQSSQEKSASCPETAHVVVVLAVCSRSMASEIRTLTFRCHLIHRQMSMLVLCVQLLWKRDVAPSPVRTSIITKNRDVLFSRVGLSLSKPSVSLILVFSHVAYKAHLHTSAAFSACGLLKKGINTWGTHTKHNPPTPIYNAFFGKFPTLPEVYKQGNAFLMTVKFTNVLWFKKLNVKLWFRQLALLVQW